MKQMWLWLLLAAVFCGVVVVNANASALAGSVYLDDGGAGDGGDDGGGQTAELKPAWLCDQPDGEDGGDGDGGQITDGGCE